jgi:hypothetical protein
MDGEILTDKVQEFLKAYSPVVQEIATQVRELVVKLLPDAHEKVYTGWKTIGYSPTGGMKDAICSIGPHTKHVNIVFFRGTELDDPEQLLEGTGKKGRHVKIRSVEDAKSKALEQLIINAVKLEKP